MPSQPASSGRTPRKRPTPPARPAAKKELRPWQLGAFILIGLAVLGIALGFSYARKFHQEYGQYPWAKTAVPPRMYFDHWDYVSSNGAPMTNPVKIGTSPGGGTIYATSPKEKPAPSTIEVQGGGRTQLYTIAPKK